MGGTEITVIFNGLNGDFKLFFNFFSVSIKKYILIHMETSAQRVFLNEVKLRESVFLTSCPCLSAAKKPGG
jgi:hypothetical protein